MLDGLLSLESGLVKMHRYPQHFERTIQFSRTERKVTSVVGGQDIRLLALECQPKICFFFGSIRAHPRDPTSPDLFPNLSEIDAHPVLMRTPASRTIETGIGKTSR